MRNTRVLLAAGLFSAGAAADDVYLKGGGKVSGRVVQRTETSVEIEVGAGKIAVPAKSVERIVEGRSSLESYQERAGSLKPTDKEGWLALGRWASDQGLSSQAREAFNRVLAIDPANVEANEGLGRIQVNGRWLAEDDAYRARGFVKYDGDWMTPAEKATLERQRTAQADADRARASAENRARQAEARAEEAEARAKAASDAQQQEQQGIPLWWGWGPGPVLWPAQPVVPPQARTGGRVR